MNQVTVRIIGGLGNQLHCYALGKAIAEKNGVALYIDCESGYWSDPYQRTFLLDEFPHLCIKKVTVPKSWWGQLLYKALVKAKSVMSRYIPLEWRPIVVEPRPYCYRPEVHRAKYHVNPLFVGYWATYRYYDEVKELLRHELSPPQPDHPIVLRMLDEITSTESCAIHWRSYVEEEDGFHPPLEKYYQEAITHLQKLYPSIRFFVFSDNYALARRELASLEKHVTFVELPEAVGNRQSLNDFYLMYACKHAIIGDSTFSWWAAWLSEKTGKTVIAPGGLSPWGKDWAPENWISIPIIIKD